VLILEPHYIKLQVCLELTSDLHRLPTCPVLCFLTPQSEMELWVFLDADVDASSVLGPQPVTLNHCHLFPFKWLAPGGRGVALC